jgi:trehalose 6-phosphate synthase
MSHVVLASDRGPVAFVRQGERLLPQARTSSVARILDVAARSVDAQVTWISLSSSAADAAARAAGGFAGLSRDHGYELDAVPLSQREYRGYYEEAGVRMLWLANHDLWDEPSVRHVTRPDGAAFHRCYQRVNQRVAAEVARACRPRSLVVLHDYQLATAPAALRRLRPRQPIAHFTHTPFPDPAALSRLPAEVAAGVLDGMLAADLLGFQCRRWAERFLACCESSGAQVDQREGRVSRGGRVTWVRCYPLRLDAAGVLRRSRSTGVQAWVDRITGGDRRQLLVRVDRLDPAKNALRGFQAFRLLLERRPELRDRVRFVACLIPSRERVPEYQSYREQLWEEIHRLEARHPGTVVVHDGDDPERSLAALRVYRVLLVNSLLDGMNLVALEGALVNQAGGAVVLSRGAGCAERLGDHPVVIERPREVEATAAALHAALSMGEGERQRRAAAMRQLAGAGTPGGWLSDQLADLRSVCGGGAPSAGQW